MADNKSNTTTEVPGREDDFQTEDNVESPLEELDRARPSTKKRERKNPLKFIIKIERKKENQVQPGFQGHLCSC